MGILDQHIQSNNSVSRFYFKVNLNDDIENIINLSSSLKFKRPNNNNSTRGKNKPLYRPSRSRSEVLFER